MLILVGNTNTNRVLRKEIKGKFCNPKKKTEV